MCFSRLSSVFVLCNQNNTWPSGCQSNLRGISIWHDPKEFLKKGTSDQWQGTVPDDLLREFDIGLMELAGEEMGAWLLYGMGGLNVRWQVPLTAV